MRRLGASCCDDTLDRPAAARLRLDPGDVPARAAARASRRGRRARTPRAPANAQWKPARAPPVVRAAAACRPAAASVERTARPSAPPICCDVLNSPDASPWSSSSRPVVAISVSGMNTAPMPSDVRSIAGSTSATYEPSTGSCVSSSSPAAVSSNPIDGDRPHADPRRELRREPGGDHDPGRERQEREPGLQRPVAEHALDVERVEEEHREHPRHREEHRRCSPSGASGRGRSRAARAAPSPAARSATKPRAAATARDEEADRRRRGPARRLRLDDRVDERHQAAGHGDRAGDVVAPLRVLVARLGDEPQRERRTRRCRPGR